MEHVRTAASQNHVLQRGMWLPEQGFTGVLRAFMSFRQVACEFSRDAWAASPSNIIISFFIRRCVTPEPASLCRSAVLTATLLESEPASSQLGTKKGSCDGRPEELQRETKRQEPVADVGSSGWLRMAQDSSG